MPRDDASADFIAFCPVNRYYVILYVTRIWQQTDRESEREAP